MCYISISIYIYNIYIYIKKMPLSVVISANYTKVQAALLQLASNEIFLKNPDCLKDLVAQLVKAAPPQPAQQVPAPRDGSETRVQPLPKDLWWKNNKFRMMGKTRKPTNHSGQSSNEQNAHQEDRNKRINKGRFNPPGADSSAPAEKTPAEQAGTEPMENTR